MGNRRSSLYTLTVESTVPEEAVTTMIKMIPPMTLAGAGTMHRSQAFIRFRAASDEEALTIADQLTDLDGVLKTGFGVNERTVTR